MDRRRPKLQRAILLAVDRDGDVHHLDVLRGADRAVRVWRDERKSKDATVIRSRLSVETDHRRDAGQRTSQLGRDRVFLPAVQRRTSHLRLGRFLVRRGLRIAVAHNQLRQRRGSIVLRVLQHVRTAGKRRVGENRGDQHNTQRQEKTLVEGLARTGHEASMSSTVQRRGRDSTPSNSARQCGLIATVFPVQVGAGALACPLFAQNGNKYDTFTKTSFPRSDRSSGVLRWWLNPTKNAERAVKS